ncbi:type II toxin-antitoxin system PemK/MazF family toxin [Rhodomicrobium sp. Az07]|uniref:type II toxin-antitoxin system PemK/MazF family toxin n=1 Tax=Rhodomicrobium sp. Az07 TaxID=2839034 RepID=UPI001BE984EB|nr:type II toxin-antitoxin system PemK/MazF family toxin [Rhodomicrobium sp. Az07]MBT3070293.1 type II toxin-antitoxin system PemK/MazF family toxin [Rhodomicrobium sp. Az07]
MIKRRPAIVVSPRLPYRDGLCAVVPLSTTQPAHEVAYVVKIELEQPLPAPFDFPICWAKCDMIATVAFERLDLFRTGRDANGKRKYLTPRLSQATFEAVKPGILAGLGIELEESR